MGEIYERMDNMVGEIKDAMKDNNYSTYFPQIKEIVLDRWDKMTITQLTLLGVMEAFERIEKNKDERRILREQFATFHMKKEIILNLQHKPMPLQWIQLIGGRHYGLETPELAEIAKKVLSQPINSSSAERNWSAYSYIHNSSGIV